MVDVWTIMNESIILTIFGLTSRRKKEAREVHQASKVAQKLTGLKAKIHNRKRHVAKIQMKKQIKQHEQRNVKKTEDSGPPEGAVPTYLLDRAQEKNAKQLSSMVKQKRKEAAARFSVPLPKVRGMSEEEVFKVLKTGKSKRKSWKRVISKPTFVGEGFTRRPVKMERFIRPMALRMKKANVTHRELAVTVQCPIIGVKKNPNSPIYTQLGVLTRGVSSQDGLNADYGRR